MKRLRYLVESVQCCCAYLDEYPLATDSECHVIFDDNKIGGEKRKALASVLRRIRADKENRQLLVSRVQRALKSIRKNPHEYGKRKPPSYYRKYPVICRIAAQEAKSHRDCAYCGVGYLDGVSICGRCKEEGIDGPTIRGTAARKAKQYVQWRKRK